MITLQFILENAPKEEVQKAVSGFNVATLPYSFKRTVLNEYPEYRGRELQLGIDISDVMHEFKTEWMEMDANDLRIREIQRKLKLIGKWHSDYKQLCIEHDMLVLINNELNKPITAFLKLYKKAQKALGKNISVTKKKESIFQKPA